MRRVCVTQKEEDKKSAGPKASKNHQQRLENIVKQTTVESRVRRTNTDMLLAAGKSLLLWINTA